MSSDKNFWLITIQNTWLAVGLVVFENDRYVVKNIGPKVTGEWYDQDTLIKAIDSSLSAAANEVGLPPEAEPSKAAFILPPFWVGIDSRIQEEKFKLIESVCKSLDFKPMGFIADDEAIVEDSNLKEGLPVSFVLVNLSPTQVVVSLVYLGKVKSRINRSVPSEGFDPTLIETALSEINIDNALPPQILVFGDYPASWINQIKNYNWINKRPNSTFLHLPDINSIDYGSLFDLFCEVIVSQIDVGRTIATAAATNLNSYETVEVIDEEVVDPEVEPELEVQDDSYSKVEEPSDEEENSEPVEELQEESKKESDLAEASADEFGFSAPQDDPLPSSDFQPELDQISSTQFQATTVSPIIPTQISSSKKFRLPKLNFKFNSHWLKSYPLIILLALGLVFLFGPIFLSKSKVTVFLTPYTYSKSVNVTLDSQALNFSAADNIIPVTKKEFTIRASDNVPATGHKTTGDKAKGEIVIFNKQDKTASIPKGSVLTDSSGKKFELVTSVSVVASSADLQNGVITMGQTRAMVQAADIGSEFNLAKDVQLSFKDFATTTLVARTTQELTGGFSKEINAVSEADRKSLEAKLSTDLTALIDEKLQLEVDTLQGALKDTVSIKKSRPEYGREVGEEAQDLSGEITADVSVFVVNPDFKESIVNSYLSQEDGFSQSSYDLNDFKLNFVISKNHDQKATGKLIIEGKSTPTMDTQTLAKNLTLKTSSQADQIIKNQSKRVYDYKITHNFEGLIKVLPFSSSNILIDVKSE